MKSGLTAGVACGAVMLWAASSASAATHNIGTISEPSGTFSAKITGSAASFTDDITFTLPYDDQFVVVSFSASTAIRISGSHPEEDYALTDGQLELFSGVPGSGVAVAGEGGAVTGSNQVYSAGLAPITLPEGQYYLQFTGTYDPTKWNGSKYVLDTSSKLTYSGTISVSAVPESGTWALMVLGFAGLAFAGGRTRKGVALAA